MDFINHDKPDIPQMLLHDPSRHHRLQSLRRRDQHVRRTLRLSYPLTRLSIPMSYADSQIELLTPPLQSVQQVAIQRFQRRNVQQFDSLTSLWIRNQSSQDRKQSRFGLAARGRRDQEDILAFEYVGYGL